MDDIEGAGKRAPLDHRVGHSDWFELVGEHREITGGGYQLCSQREGIHMCKFVKSGEINIGRKRKLRRSYRGQLGVRNDVITLFKVYLS
jgi:hypothetical protein